MLKNFSCPIPRPLFLDQRLPNKLASISLSPHLSSPLSLSTGYPQGCVLSPLLYALYTYDCIPTQPTNVIVKYADETTMVRLISDVDETAYRAKEEN